MTHGPSGNARRHRDTYDKREIIGLITKENPSGFLLTGALHVCLDCFRKRPFTASEFRELSDDIGRTLPISIAEHDKLIN